VARERHRSTLKRRRSATRMWTDHRHTHRSARHARLPVVQEFLIPSRVTSADSRRRNRRTISSSRQARSPASMRVPRETARTPSMLPDLRPSQPRSGQLSAQRHGPPRRGMRAPCPLDIPPRSATSLAGATLPLHVAHHVVRRAAHPPTRRPQLSRGMPLAGRSSVAQPPAHLMSRRSTPDDLGRNPIHIAGLTSRRPSRRRTNTHQGMMRPRSRHPTVVRARGVAIDPLSSPGRP
jgi:hypothetical protein